MLRDRGSKDAPYQTQSGVTNLSGFEAKNFKVETRVEGEIWWRRRKK